MTRNTSPVLENRTLESGDPATWRCDNCGHVGFSADAPPASATPEDLADADVFWCDECGLRETR